MRFQQGGIYRVLRFFAYYPDAAGKAINNASRDDTPVVRLLLQEQASPRPQNRLMSRPKIQVFIQSNRTRILFLKLTSLVR